jgi:hypothetical protein
MRSKPASLKSGIVQPFLALQAQKVICRHQILECFSSDKSKSTQPFAVLETVNHLECFVGSVEGRDARDTERPLPPEIFGPTLNSSIVAFQPNSIGFSSKVAMANSQGIHATLSDGERIWSVPKTAAERGEISKVVSVQPNTLESKEQSWIVVTRGKVRSEGFPDHCKIIARKKFGKQRKHREYVTELMQRRVIALWRTIGAMVTDIRKKGCLEIFEALILKHFPENLLQNLDIDLGSRIAGPPQSSSTISNQYSHWSAENNV